jgi:glycosyltransferase involved in cell wall biosynthesis
MLRGGDVPGSERTLQLYHKLLQPLRRAVYRKSMMIFANSNGLKQIAEEADRGFTVNVIPNGVDTEYFYPTTETDSGKNKPFTFLFVGRICSQKNISVLIRAFSECQQYHPEIKLNIAGDGPQLNQLKILARKHGSESQIHWTGWQTKENVRSLYRNSDCLVNPSFNEGLPNVVLEAMACGRAVIASDCAGNNDLIINGYNGFLFPVDKHSELVRIMLSIIDKRVLCGELGLHGRELCCKQYSWKAVTAEFESVICKRKIAA